MTRAELDNLCFDNYLRGAALEPRLRALGIPCPSSADTHRGRSSAGTRRPTSSPRPGHTRTLIPADIRMRAAAVAAAERGYVVRVGIGRITGAR